ncbi:hypothetical protein [Methylomonas koyamae]|uniref:Uncharacterized protein n=1 Tax=Methylomonas koyamae TaxID=702114 RepID=A0AA91DC64_9GAMM|nr:hypothetical protein [Methylomonas koyamae]OAI25783.1 hypothetical protein A1356_12895 [Methylomonas koyamae]
MPDTDSISTLVGKILEQFSKPVEFDGRTLLLSCFIGFGVYPDDGDRGFCFICCEIWATASPPFYGSDYAGFGNIAEL